MTRWSYEVVKVERGGFFGGKVDTDELGDLLNRMGAVGWELVSAFGTSYGEGTSREVLLLPKRPT